VRRAVGVVSERTRSLPSDDSRSATERTPEIDVETTTLTFCLSEVNDNSLDSGVATTSIAALDAP
jgi:hypothetical protein